MAGLTDNLKAAEQAVSYVKTMLPLGASNVPENVLLSGGGSSACFSSLRASYSDEINSDSKQTLGLSEQPMPPNMRAALNSVQ
jgi:hypothetical protein